MTINQTLIGETAARLMDKLPDEAQGEVIAVGIIAIVDNEDSNYTRISCSCDRYHEQLGLFTAALELVQNGQEPDEEDNQ